MKGLLFITHRNAVYDYLDSVRIALEGGCRRIQLRMKDHTAADVERTGRRAMEMCAPYGAELWVDDHVEVCLSIGAAGVHLGRMDMAPSAARRILGPGFGIGGTANTMDDICRLRDEGVDYVGLGPFRFTTTKKNLSPVLGLAGYADIIEKCRKRGMGLPVVAIGGIMCGDIPDLIRAGVSGVALSSSILGAADPVGETREIIETINGCQG